MYVHQTDNTVLVFLSVFDHLNIQAILIPYCARRINIWTKVKSENTSNATRYTWNFIHCKTLSSEKIHDQRQFVSQKLTIYRSINNYYLSRMTNYWNYYRRQCPKNRYTKCNRIFGKHLPKLYRNIRLYSTCSINKIYVNCKLNSRLIQCDFSVISHSFSQYLSIIETAISFSIVSFILIYFSR